MKKTKSTSAKAQKAIFEPAAEQLAVKHDATATAAVSHEDITAKEEAGQTAEPAKKTRKLVEFKVLKSAMAHQTEKAQLLAFITEQGEQVKLWIAKSLMNAKADSNDPDKTICRIPAWLYYKTGLNNFFPVTRWSSQAI